MTRPATRPRGDRSCGADLPVLEDQRTGPLHLRPASPGRRPGTARDRSRTAGHCLHETAAEAAGKSIYDQPAERQDFYD
jgi:hypothetical protein